MQPLWTFSTYQDYIKSFLTNVAPGTRGGSTKLARGIGIHATLLSQILRGDRNLTAEQAALFCDYSGLTDLETELFLRMVDYQRAGNESLREKLKLQITALKEQFSKVSSRVSKNATKLTMQEKAIFYSSWHYSAVRMLCTLKESLSLEELSQKLSTTPKRIQEVVAFLVSTGLLSQDSDGLKIGPTTTHIEADSPWVTRHHSNWRVKNLSRLDKIDKNELCFTAPLTCSEKDFSNIREKILELIGEISGIVSNTEPEKAYVLCLDFLFMNEK